MLVSHRSSLKTSPAWPGKTWPGFKNITTTDTHEFIQLFLYHMQSAGSLFYAWNYGNLLCQIHSRNFSWQCL